MGAQAATHKATRLLACAPLIFLLRSILTECSIYVARSGAYAMTFLQQVELNAEFRKRSEDEPVFGRMVREFSIRADFLLAEGLSSPEAARVCHEKEQLSSYWDDAEHHLTEGDIAKSYEANLESRWTVAEAEAYAKLQRIVPARRPREGRTIAAKALQMRASNTPWKMIADELCSCGKTVHDESCREKIRQRAHSLRKLLAACECRVLPNEPGVDKSAAFFTVNN